MICALKSVKKKVRVEDIMWWLELWGRSIIEFTHVVHGYSRACSVSYIYILKNKNKYITRHQINVLIINECICMTLLVVILLTNFHLQNIFFCNILRYRFTTKIHPQSCYELTLRTGSWQDWRNVLINRVKISLKQIKVNLQL